MRAGVEVAREELPGVLGVTRLGGGREPDEVGEEDGDEPALGGRRRRGSGSELAVPSGDPHSPQNFISGALGVPQDGHARASELPHSPQNFRPSSFSALRGQTMLVTSAVSHVREGPRKRSALGSGGE